MSRHTKGPWKENACEIQAQDGSPICEMLARPEDSGANYPYSPEADANSRLICAAPELLAALKEVLNLRIGYLYEKYEIDDPHDDPTGLCVNLSYLISKAE